MTLSKERENFFRYSTLAVDHVNEAFRNLLDHYISKQGLTLHNFINNNAHEIYHFFSNFSCCLCPPGLYRLVRKVLNQAQFEILLDTKGKKQIGHNLLGRSKNYGCLVNPQLTIEQLDVTLASFLLLNFTPIEKDVQLKQAVEGLREFRNSWAHAKAANIPQHLYEKNIKDIETWLLEIAKVCGMEREVRQKIEDAKVRPLDEDICKKYEIRLLEDVVNQGDIKKRLRSFEKKIDAFSNVIEQLPILKSQRNQVSDDLKSKAHGTEEIEVEESTRSTDCSLKVVLTDKSLNEISRHLLQDWQDVFIHLNMSHQDMIAIEEDYKGNIKRQAFKSLITWRDSNLKRNKDQEQMVEDLRNVLKELNRGDVLSIINKMLDRKGEEKSENKRPSSPEMLISDQNLIKVAKMLSTDWHMAAIYLGLSRRDIQEIEQRYPLNLKLQAFEGLTRCRNKITCQDSYPSSFEQEFINMLKSIDRQDILDKFITTEGDTVKKTRLCNDRLQLSGTSGQIVVPFTRNKSCSTPTASSLTCRIDNLNLPTFSSEKNSMTVLVIYKSGLLPGGPNQERIDILLFDDIDYIHAKAFENHARSINKRIEKDRVYYISNFNIIPGRCSQTSVRLLESTRINALSDDIIENKSSRKLKIFEVIGYCKSQQIISLGPVIITAIGPLRQPGTKPTWLKEVMLKDESGKIILNIWGLDNDTNFPYKLGNVIELLHTEVSVFNANSNPEVSVTLKNEFSIIKPVSQNDMQKLLNKEDKDELTPVELKIKDMHRISRGKHTVILSEVKLQSFAKQGKKEMFFMNCNSIINHGRLEQKNEEWFCKECNEKRKGIKMIQLDCRICDDSDQKGVWVKLYNKASEIVLRNQYQDFLKYGRAEQEQILKDIEKYDTRYRIELCITESNTRIVKKITTHA